MDINLASPQGQLLIGLDKLPRKRQVNRVCLCFWSFLDQQSIKKVNVKIRGDRCRISFSKSPRSKTSPTIPANILDDLLELGYLESISFNHHLNAVDVLIKC